MRIRKKRLYMTMAVFGIIVLIVVIFNVYQIKRIEEKYFHIKYDDVLNIKINSEELTDEDLKKNIISAYNDLKDVDIDSDVQIGTPDCNIYIFLKNGVEISIDEYITVYVYLKQKTYCFNAKNQYLKNLMKDYIKRELD